MDGSESALRKWAEMDRMNHTDAPRALSEAKQAVLDEMNLYPALTQEESHQKQQEALRQIASETEELRSFVADKRLLSLLDDVLTAIERNDDQREYYEDYVDWLPEAIAKIKNFATRRVAL